MDQPADTTNEANNRTIIIIVFLNRDGGRALWVMGETMIFRRYQSLMVEKRRPARTQLLPWSQVPLYLLLLSLPAK